MGREKLRGHGALPLSNAANRGRASRGERSPRAHAPYRRRVINERGPYPDRNTKTSVPPKAHYIYTHIRPDGACSLGQPPSRPPRYAGVDYPGALPPMYASPPCPMQPSSSLRHSSGCSEEGDVGPVGLEV